MKETVKWKCSSCGAVYEAGEPECPVCSSKEGQKKINDETMEIENFLMPKLRQKYIARYKKGRAIFKRKKVLNFA